jgi:hypothetical protein
MQDSKLKSILLINDYLSVCKIKNPNCTKTKLVRLYLCHKLSNLLDKKQKRTSLLNFLFFI